MWIAQLRRQGALTRTVVGGIFLLLSARGVWGDSRGCMGTIVSSSVTSTYWKAACCAATQGSWYSWLLTSSITTPLGPPRCRGHCRRAPPTSSYNRCVSQSVWSASSCLGTVHQPCRSALL